jgi:ABC-2 type transport system permease protein
MLGMFIIQLIFLFMGTALSAVCKSPKMSSILTSGIIVGTWLLSIGIDLTEKLDFLKYVTPFKYYEAKALIGGGGFSGVNIILSVLIMGVSIFTTYYCYNKKDL